MRSAGDRSSIAAAYHRSALTPHGRASCVAESSSNRATQPPGHPGNFENRFRNGLDELKASSYAADLKNLGQEPRLDRARRCFGFSVVSSLGDAVSLTLKACRLASAALVVRAYGGEV
jgi:hypothetical protein